MIINIQIRRKKASSPAARIVCGNTDYQIAFTFDSEWDAYTTKTARFIWNGQYADVVFSGNVCDVPKITDTTLCMVGVFAGDLHTTTPAYIKCDRSILCGDGSPAEPSEDVYAQIMEKLNGGGGGGGLPSGGSAHQVLTTDADGNAGWEEKPFYIEKGAAVIESLSLVGEGEMPFAEVVPLESGNTYAVIWNGVEYICQAQPYAIDDMTAIMLGNTGAMTGTEGTGEPFFIMFLDADAAAAMGVGGMAAALDGSTSATVSIYNLIVHPIDPIYLSEAGKTIVFSVGDTGTISCNLTFAEIALCALDQNTKAIIQNFPTGLMYNGGTGVRSNLTAITVGKNDNAVWFRFVEDNYTTMPSTGVPTGFKFASLIIICTEDGFSSESC